MGDDQQKCGFLLKKYLWCGDERGRQGQMGDDQQNCGFLLKVCGVVMKGVDKGQMGDDQQKCGFLLKVCGVVMKGVDKGRWVTISRIAVSF